MHSGANFGRKVVFYKKGGRGKRARKLVINGREQITKSDWRREKKKKAFFFCVAPVKILQTL